MLPTIFSFGKGIPAHSLAQTDIAKYLSKKLILEDEEAWMLEKIYKNSCIERRYSVLPEILISERGKPAIGMSARNAIYKKEAPILAEQAARQALAKWDRPLNEITHIISVSCTGAITPGLEFKLNQALGLPPTTSRLGINFMGCFGAFKGLSVAHKIALANPKHRVLMVCTELCTLHFHAAHDIESLVINSLFADGAAAVILGCEPRTGELALFEIAAEASFALPDSEHEMTWDAADRGFDMTLSAKVPALIEQNIKPFVQALVGGEKQFNALSWAVHPGGKSILEAVQKSLQLDNTHTRSSWNVLANYGNLSSGTFLYVLDDLLARGPSSPATVGLGFGPGLSIEGLVLKNPQFKELKHV